VWLNGTLSDGWQGALSLAFFLLAVCGLDRYYPILSFWGHLAGGRIAAGFAHKLDRHIATVNCACVKRDCCRFLTEFQDLAFEPN
jgi:hypothetical protein